MDRTRLLEEVTVLEQTPQTLRKIAMAVLVGAPRQRLPQGIFAALHGPLPGLADSLRGLR